MGVAAWEVLVGGGAGLGVGRKDVAGGMAAGVERDGQACINDWAGIEVWSDFADVGSGHVHSDGCGHRSAIMAARAGS
jgi:hypothetical protein